MEMKFKEAGIIDKKGIHVDPKDMRYRFSLGMAANTRGMNYFVNP